MRATTRSTPNVSRATRAISTLELSPLVTAASAEARSIPASMSRSRSKPMPSTVCPAKPSGRRRNASGRRSITATVCPPATRPMARPLPTRPHPTTTTCTLANLLGQRPAAILTRRAEEPGLGTRHAKLTAAMYSTLKRIMIGRPIPSSEAGHQRLIKIIALAVFASDAISSTAYATDEILKTMFEHHGGAAAFAKLVPIAIIVAILLAIVVVSYRQTIFAYPSGGGSYVVSPENLGETPSLVAGASLLTDYILTVSVSVAGGVLAITSAFPSLSSQRVPICLGFVVLMTVANLRGVKESGRIFAGPTYVYTISLLILIAYGLYQSYAGHIGTLPVPERLRELEQNTQVLGLFILLRAFSSGAVALSGAHAISNGVPAFHKPESKNAATTLTFMAIILGVTFFGVSLLAHRLKPFLGTDDSGLSIMAAAVFGKGAMYYILQFSTFAILILAANTAYNGFPLLSSIIAQDGFLPRHLANRA